MGSASAERGTFEGRHICGTPCTSLGARRGLEQEATNNIQQRHHATAMLPVTKSLWSLVVPILTDAV